MKILLVAHRNPCFLHTNHYREQALRALGHEVFFFDIRHYWLKARLREWFPLLERLELLRINNALVRREKEKSVDLCLVVGGNNVFSSTVRDMREAGVFVALWTTDVPHPGTYENIRAAAQEYTKVFCAGTEAIRWLEESGFKKAEWLPFCCDPQVHVPQGLSSDEKKSYGHDVVFVGSYYPNRKDMFEALSDVDLGIWGALWDRLPIDSAIRSKVVGLHTDVSVWTKIYSAAKIVLAVHFYQEGVPCDQASPKLFEAMACGAFVLCDDQKDARTLFKDGEHLVFFKDAEDLRSKVEYYLAHPKERQRIASAGRAEVLAHHTYEKRLSGILDEARALRKEGGVR